MLQNLSQTNSTICRDRSNSNLPQNPNIIGYHKCKANNNERFLNHNSIMNYAGLNKKPEQKAMQKTMALKFSLCITVKSYAV